MKRLVLIPFLFPVAALFAAPNTLEDSVVIFRGERETRAIGKHLWFLEDRDASLAVQDAVVSHEFQPVTSEVPNFGVTRSAYWLKYRLVNVSPENQLNMLVDHAEIDELDVYLIRDGAAPMHLVESGGTRSVDRQVSDAPAYTFTLPVPYGGTGWVFLRVKSDKQLQVPIFLLNERGVANLNLNRNFFIGGYAGIMAVMLLYNFLLFLSIKDNNYLYYSIYILSVGLTQITFLGYASFYLWPGAPWINAYAAPTLTVVTMITAVEFMQRFTNAKAYIPGFRTVKIGVYAVALAGVVACLAGYGTVSYQVIQLTSTVMASYMLYVSTRLALNGHKPGKFFLAAWLIFMSGIVIFVAKDWGFLPYNDITKHMMTIGSAVEVVLLSFGLADKINTLRHEKEQLILEQYQVLEQRVAERTQELEESNLHLKRTQSKLVSAEKMASLGQLTAGIAHEINNPLNFISSNIPPLKRNLLDLKEVLDNYRHVTKDNPACEPVRALEQRIDMDFTVKEVEEIMGCIENGAHRTSEIVRGLRTFSRLDEDDLKPADINEGMRSTVVVLGPQMRDAVTIDFDLGELPLVECYPGKLNQVFMNLLNNAAHAVKQRHGRSGGRIAISTRAMDGLVKITIADNGIGMDETVQRRLFEPFFTTKAVGEGTGLGLSICQGIVEKHNGTLELDSTPGVGSSFTIIIPVNQESRLAKSA